MSVQITQFSGLSLTSRPVKVTTEFSGLSLSSIPVKVVTDFSGISLVSNVNLVINVLDSETGLPVVGVGNISNLNFPTDIYTTGQISGTELIFTVYDDTTLEITIGSAGYFNQTVQFIIDSDAINLFTILLVPIPNLPVGCETILTDNLGNEIPVLIQGIENYVQTTFTVASNILANYFIEITQNPIGGTVASGEILPHTSQVVGAQIVSRAKVTKLGAYYFTALIRLKC